MSVALTDWRPVARGRAAPERPLSGAQVPSPLPAHVGVWLDRMLHDPGRSDEKPGRAALYAAAIQALRPEAPATANYKPCFERWRRSLQDDPGVRVRLVELEATSRLLLHPASNQSVTDGSVLLHHTYGVPYLPGSALKGVLRRAIERAGGDHGHALAAELLGPDRDVPGQREAADQRGWLDLLDALWIPGSGSKAEQSPLALDIVNPHHPDWYTRSNKARQPARDYDSPVPTHRLSIAPGARFLFALEWSGRPGDDPLAPVVERALSLLGDALEQDGIGAWTSIGYGRLRATILGAPIAAVATPAVWRPARMERDPGTGRLTATLEDGARALVEGKEAAAIFQALPEAVQGRLRNRRIVAVEVQTELVGRLSRIVGARERG